MAPRASVLLSLGAVIIGFFAACGDRVGEPITAGSAGPLLDAAAAGQLQGPDAAADAQSSGGGAGPGDAQSSAGSSSEPDAYGGLCTGCNSSDDCNEHDDRCLETEAGERFCARHCDAARCPAGYDCVDVGSADPQCVPLTETCIHLEFKPAPPPLEDTLQEALGYINGIRAERGLADYQLDPCLTALAQDSAVELASTGDFLGKFERECEGQPSCECGWVAEGESNVVAYDLRIDEVFERPIDERLADAPGSDFAEALLSSQYTRIGLGIVVSGDEGWSAFAYGE